MATSKIRILSGCSVLLLAALFGGCGGGGGGDGGSSSTSTGSTSTTSGSTSTTTGGSSGTTGTSLSGLAVKGPLTGAAITYNGNLMSGVSTSHASYSFTATLPTSSTVAYPLVFSGGVDDVTGTAPIMDLTTLVTSSTTTLNANAITTMIAAAAQASVGVGATITTTAITTVQDVVVRTFGFGVDGVVSGAPTFDPFATALTGLSTQQAGEYALALEASGEMLRRIKVANSSWSMATVLGNLGTELKGGALPNTAKNASFMNAVYGVAAAISGEVVKRTLTVGPGGISLSTVTLAYSTYVGGAIPLLTSALSSTSAYLASEVKTLWNVAGNLLGAATDDGLKYISAAQAVSISSTLTTLQSQTTTINTTAFSSDIIAGMATQSSAAAATVAASAAAAMRKSTFALIDGSAAGSPSITDYGQASPYPLVSGGLGSGEDTDSPRV
ncbi:MAG: hypothetical protein HQL66_13635, partial [Magnetococcales bacterium]|nr:hypothetical protein [Magnetococcales bacterium]